MFFEQLSKIDDEEPIIKVEQRTDERTRSQNLVEEMMLLCGDVIARYAHQHSIPVIYRWGRSSYSTRFLERLDLGLDKGYVQFTSPIRRYTDVLVHYQVVASITGGSTLGKAEVEEVLVEANSETRGKTLINETKRYWIIELFRRARIEGKRFRAIVLDVRRCYSGNLEYHVLDIDLEYEGVKIHPKDVSIKDDQLWRLQPLIGKAVVVEVTEADPHHKVLTFRVSANQEL